MVQEMKREIKFADQSNEELFLLYRKSGSLEVKQEIALRYLYIVKSIAIQMRNVYAGFSQVEDIVNEGVIMLMKAIDKYEENKNARFETYVSKRIRGMIIDIARRQDWVPRTVRKSYKDMKEAITVFYTENGREPTPEEVAQRLNIQVEKYDEVMSKANLFSILSLDMVLEESMEQRKNVQIASDNWKEQPEMHLMENEYRKMLAEGVRSLKDNEQKVISLYYAEELNMKEIAKVLEVSEPRISQIHSNAIKKLRDYIVKKELPFTGLPVNNNKQEREKEERYVSGIL